MNKIKKIFKKILEIDYKIFGKLFKYNKKTFIIFIAHLGNIIVILFVVLLFYFLPFANGKKASIISFVSLFINTLIVFIIKFTVRRKRVSENNPLLINIETYSFPSGHINRISSLIFPFYYFPIFSIFFLIIAISGSIARMARGYHYLSDCIVGFLIGIIVGFLVTKFSFLYVNHFIKIIDLIIVK